MKKLAMIFFSLLLFSVLIVSESKVFASEIKLIGADASFEAGNLTVEKMLTYSIESQYLTNYMNNTIIEKFGKVRPYNVMVENNKKNISKLEILFYKNKLVVPEDISKGYFTANSDFNKNLELSYENEMKKIVMFETFLKKGLPEDVRTAFELLKLNSKKNLQAIELSLSDIYGIKSKTTIDHNIVTRFFNWLGRSFDRLFIFNR